MQVFAIPLRTRFRGITVRDREGTPPVVSEADTMGNMRVLDEIRRHLGVRFCP